MEKLYNSREVFERKYICRDYERNEIIEPTTISGDSDVCLIDSNLLTSQILAQSQDRITYPTTEIYKIVFGTNTGITITNDGVGNVLNINLDRYNYSTFLSNNGVNTNVGQIGNFFDAQISRPISEGDPYKIDNYTPGQTVQTTISDVTIEHTSKVRYQTGDIFSVIVYDADNINILDQIEYSLSNFTFDAGSFNNKIRISLQNIETDINEFSGEFKAIINPNVILNGISGKLNVRFTISGQSYNSNFFYDSSEILPIVDSVNLNITSGTTNQLSGISFYETLDLNVGVTFSRTNYHTWIRPFLTINLDALNMPTLNVDDQTPSSLLTWDDAYDESGSIYNNINWSAPTETFALEFSNNNVFVSAINSKGVVNNSLSSLLSPIHYDSRSRISTDTIERFKTEIYRVSQSSNFDLPNQKGWDSSLSVGSTDAKVYNLGVQHNVSNFSGLLPIGQFNYSSHSTNQVYIREFITNGTAHSSFTLNVTGTYNLMEYKLAKAWDNTSTGGTTWIRGDQPFNLANWNNGNPDSGFGGSLGGNLYSFGNNNIINTNNTLYLRFTFITGQRISSLSVVFN